MRKFKKFLAGLLGTATILSSMTMTVFAAPVTTGQTNTTATFGNQTTGKLTIHKYEDNDQNGDVGTGLNSDANSLTGQGGVSPEGINPMPGVEFTIYQIADADALADYYSTNPDSLPDIEGGYYTGNGTETPGYTYTGKDQVTAKDADGVAQPVKYAQTTNNNGVATFDNIPLGIYVVVETKEADAISAPVKPFMVSIPMTTVDGDNWLYDVEVFPKNKTSYGGINLEKLGKTAGSDSTVKLSDVTFELYKKVAADSDNAVAVPGETTKEWLRIIRKASSLGDNTGVLKGEDGSVTAEPATLNLTTDTKGLISVDGLSKGTYRFYETDRGANDGYIADTTAYYEFEILKGGKAQYKKIDAAGNETTVTEDSEKLTLTATNEKPDFDKEVKDRVDTTNPWGHDADYSVGALVPYKLTIQVPTNITKLNTFTVTDNPTHLDDQIAYLTLDNTNTAVAGMKVYCGTVNLSRENVAGVDATTAAYSVEESGTGNQGFTLTFHPKNMAAYAGKTIIVEYNAKLLAGAETSVEGNPNTATLEYTNKIVPDYTTGEDSKDKIEDKAVVYTFQINLNKYADSEKEENRLAGVEFNLYRYTGDDAASMTTEDKLKAATEAELIKVTGSNGTYEYAKDATATDAATLQVADGSNGTTKGALSVKGLENGTYFLVETKTAEDYNLLQKPIQVTLQVGYAYQWTETSEFENGVLTKHTYDYKDFKFTNTDDTTGKVGYEAETVINKKGFTLPLTGGMGTIIFTFGGIALALAGFMIIMASRKKTA